MNILEKSPKCKEKYSGGKIFITIACCSVCMRKPTFPVLTAEELVRTGEALFGAHWRSELARLLANGDEALLRAVEAGRQAAPQDWRALLIAASQDVALRAMDAASALLSTDEEIAQSPAYRVAVN